MTQHRDPDSSFRRRTLVAALVATAGLGSVALDAVADNSDTSAVAPPTTPVPLPPTTVLAVPAPVAGSALPANATLDQLRAAIQPMFGPTTDLAAEFAIFGITPPAEIPTPAGAEVDSFEFTLSNLTDLENAYYFATAILRSTQPPAEVVTLYQTGLLAAGFTQTGDSVETDDDGRQIRWLEFDLPNSTGVIADFADFVVGVVDDVDDDFIQIEWHDAVDPALAAPFTSWSGVPLVDQTAQIASASIWYLGIGTRVRIDTDYVVPIDFAQLESQFLAALPTSPFTLDAEASVPGSWAALTGGPLEDLQVDFVDVLDPGTSKLAVGAYFESQG